LFIPLLFVSNLRTRKMTSFQRTTNPRARSRLPQGVPLGYSYHPHLPNQKLPVQHPSLPSLRARRNRKFRSLKPVGCLDYHPNPNRKSPVQLQTRTRIYSVCQPQPGPKAPLLLVHPVQIAHLHRLLLHHQNQLLRLLQHQSGWVDRRRGRLVVRSIRRR
jgi:hypothetical protein